MFSLKVFMFAMTAAAAIVAAEHTDKAPVEILTERTINREDGYDFGFKTSDGSSRHEEAELISVGEHKGIGVKGSYSYIAPDGLEYTVTYTADDKGFNPIIRVVHPDTQ